MRPVVLTQCSVWLESRLAMNQAKRFSIPAGFQFGGATPFGSPANNAGVFSFGGGAPPALSTAPSVAPQQTAQAGFSFSQQPAFNIG